MKPPKTAARLKKKRLVRPLGSPSVTQSKAEYQHVVHELQVHQQELEAQNDELRETQQLLETSRDRYADLYDFAPIGYATIDGKGHVHEINLTGATILGWERSRLLGTLFSMAVARDDLPLFHAHLRQCQQTKGPVTTELKLTARGRNPLPVQLYSVPIPDLIDQTVMYRTAITDVSLRVLAEERLHQTLNKLEERVRERTAELAGVVVELRKEVAERERAEASLRLQDSIVKNMAEGVCLIRVRDNAIIYANPTFEKLFGYDSGELTGKHASVLNYGLPGKNPRQVAREVNDQLVAHEIAIYEIQNVRKDATPFWCRAHTSTFKHPEHGRIWVAVHEDITEHKRGEEALKLFRTLVDHSHDSLEVIDPESARFLDVSLRGCLDLGYSREELLSMRVFDITPDIEPAWPANLEALRRDKSLTVFGHHRRKDGTQFPVEVNVSLVTLDRDYLVAVVRDTTERKQTEEALRQLSVSLLKTQDRERRRIARELHDSTGQKLAALAMNLSLIGKSAGTLDARGREVLMDSVGLLDQSARELRTLSYLLHPPLLDERGLGAAVRWFTDGFTQRSGVRVTLQMPEDLQRLPEEIEIALFRIVQEGLTNAHRHSGSATATIRLTADLNHVQLEVQDAGNGLSGPQTDNTMNSLGVGITGMRERVKQLGGHMKLESGLQGTIVRVTVPLAGATT